VHADRQRHTRAIVVQSVPVANTDDLPVLTCVSQLAWDKWLAEHQRSSEGVWLKIAKAASGLDTVTYAEALDVALCYGWIDGLRKKFDDDWFVQRFTPRTPKSKWSKINCEKATALIANGRMQLAGLQAVEQAKADGRWRDAYAGQRDAIVPDDLQRALDKNKRARTFFDTLDGRNRYAILYRVHDAKRPETRARRIAQYVTMLSKQEKLYP
jgi:uncharacterized protein YdeI (YjbR/CyaY-like superfamily)